VYSFRGVIVIVLFYILINNIHSIIVLLAIIALLSLAYNPTGYRRLGNDRATREDCPKVFPYILAPFLRNQTLFLTLTLSLLEIVELTFNSEFFVRYGNRDARECRTLELTAASINPNPVKPHQTHQ